jgi:hypothetical protein
MKDLLSSYSLKEILIFIVILCIAIKSVVSFYDWAKGRLGIVFDKESDTKQIVAEIKELINENNKKIDELYQLYQKVQNNIQKLTESVDGLIDSDKDGIKAWITREHHYFCYEKRYIDDSSLDALEKRFKHYKDEGGNGFVDDLMADIRALPKVSSAEAIERGNRNEKA